MWLVCNIFAFEGNLVLSATFIFYGAFFDFFDGLLARILKVGSEFGKQLDSLADMVTFGVAPGMILFQLIYNSIVNSFSQSDITQPNFFPSIIAFLIPIFSAIRLAKFNTDTRQTTAFIGLPTPAAAVFIASLPMIRESYSLSFSSELLIGATIVLSLLLVAKIPLFSFKFSKAESITSRLNIFRIILIIVALILLFIFQFAAIPFIVILYLILSILNNIL